MEEKRIYAIVAGTVTVPAKRLVVQPLGRQCAQVAHVVSKLRHSMLKLDIDEKTLPIKELLCVTTHRMEFFPITTITLQARDSQELAHVYNLALKKKLGPVFFDDDNESAYGPGLVRTAVAFLATPKENVSVADYLPLWGS